MTNSVFHFPLIKKREIAKSTYEFTFDSQGSGYTFNPGHYAYVTLSKPSMSDPTRIFSFANAPRENGELIIAARIRPESDYKRALADLRVGENVQISRAIGFFDLPSDTTLPLVFIAGGIGVVPFISLLESLVLAHQDRTVTVVVSNASPHTSVYLEKIESLIRNIPSSKLIITFTRSKEHGAEEGRATLEMLQKHQVIIPQTRYFLAGTPTMVDDFVHKLYTRDIPLSNIHIEAFTGY